MLEAAIRREAEGVRAKLIDLGVDLRRFRRTTIAVLRRQSEVVP